jgi:gliding motility-associated-like protein
MNHDMFLKRSFFFLCALVFLQATELFGQACEDALGNYMCADQPQQVDSLNPSTPFFNNCMNVSSTVWYSFHTNTLETGSIDIAVDFVDCDYTTAGDNDFIYATVFELIDGFDPCISFASYNWPCAGDDQSFVYTMPSDSIQPDTDYIVVIGSNHDTIYGPCAFDVTISGSSLDIVARVEPLSVSLGQSAHLIVDGTEGPVQWTPGQYLDDPTSLNPEVFAEETSSFQVSGQVGNCDVTDVVSLTVGTPIEIYTAFSPNSDGVNDVWNIGDIERFPTCQIEVFDRWGQSVFKSVGYKQPWNGTYKDRYLPTASYYYVIELNSLEVTIPPILGTVSIVH